MGDDLRSLALSDDAFGTTIIEHKGAKYEIRLPTLAQQRVFAKEATMKGEKEPDAVRVAVLAVIGCTFEPGTEKKVFEKADVEALEGKSTDPRTFVGKVARVIRKSMEDGLKETEESFE